MGDAISTGVWLCEPDPSFATPPSETAIGLMTENTGPNIVHSDLKLGSGPQGQTPLLPAAF